jgi:TolA-binding protein
MKKEFDHASAGFWEKVDHLVRVDYLNEVLREENVRLKAENLRLQRRLAGVHQEERTAHARMESHSEGGNEASRVTHALVPELEGGHGAVATHEEHQPEHRAPAAEEHHGAPAPHGEEHHSAPAERHDEPAPHHPVQVLEHHGDHAAVDEEEEEGRSPASAAEEEPAVTLLSAPPKKIFETALAAFQREEYDRAARGFVSLADSKENTRYATAEVHFMAGVSLFKVRNYQVAMKQLDDVLSAHGADAQALAPKALMWKALCLKKLGRDSDSKKTAQTILERYPASAEAQKVK